MSTYQRIKLICQMTDFTWAYVRDRIPTSEQIALAEYYLSF